MSSTMDKVLQSTCLKPKYSLRRQLLVSFGMTSFVAIGAVMLIATMTAKYAGEEIKEEARMALEDQVIRNLHLSSTYVAETIAKKFEYIGGAADLMAEVTMDRIVGYPNDGYENDAHVPFFDIISKANRYPLQSELLPRDWNITKNVNESNFEEHIQERRSWYSDLSFISTASSTYRFQGCCDPNEKDSSTKTFFPNCTNANNNITTGGVIQPTVTNRFLAEKSADIAVLLKPLYEMHNDVKVLGVYYSNSGAGGAVSYPARVIDGQARYTSIGCDWMETTNLFTGDPLATGDEIIRCHKENETVVGREYNPLERGWCRDQALNPDKTQIVGPYLDAFQKGLWLMTYGKAVFDRKTGNFIACTLLDVAVTRIDEVLQDVVVTGDSTNHIALVRWEDGTVISSSLWNASNATDTINIVNLDHFGIDEDAFRDIKSKTPAAKKNTSELLLEHQGKLVSFFPIPAIGNDNEHAPPEFLIIVSVDQTVFQAVDETDDHINDEIWTLIFKILTVGSFGLVLVISIIWVFSTILTRPLSWMELKAKQIVNSTTNAESGPRFGLGVDEEPVLKCTPKTEITYLVSEFRQMIENFSGDGAAEVASSSTDTYEVKNLLSWRHEFDYFYKPEEGDQPSGLSTGENSNEFRDENNNTVRYINRDGCQERINIGSNLSSEAEQTVRDERAHWHDLINDKNKSLLSSPLFFWIVGLIVIPLVLTIAAICTLACISITRTFPKWLAALESTSASLESTALKATIRARSSYAEEVMAEPIRDLHIISRAAGWLLFGGIKRSTSFTRLTIAAGEICKSFPPDGSCPALQDNFPCDCAWQNLRNMECRDYRNETRYLQNMHLLGQKQDSDNKTGSRWDISYPKNDFLPNSTSWWNDTQDMPGYFKGSAASGYETTYDRVRVLSALAFAEFPLHNHDRSPTSQKHITGAFVGMEADGSIIGWGGCSHGFAEGAHFKSTIDNRAAEVGNASGDDLCPLGKYGYDVRCRDWYAVGKRKGLSSGSGIHITPPYMFSGGRLIATSATSPLIDPKTGSHVGQALLDFIPEAIIRAFNSTRISDPKGSGFHVIITPETDVYGGDTVVGPGFRLGNSTKLGDLVLKFDDKASSNRLDFDNQILGSMRNGSRSSFLFTRTQDDSTRSEEQVYIEIAPVYVRTLRPLDPSDYSRGVNSSDALVYSIGLAIPKLELKLSFETCSNDAEQDIKTAAAILIALVVVVAVLAIFVSCIISLSITSPVVLLLAIVENINAKRFKDDIPPLEGGFHEVNQVYNSFARLYKVVRFSNTAFFSMNLKWAYKFLNDALSLFRMLGDQKAIGIASNNLGTVCLTALMSDGTQFIQSERGCYEIDGVCMWKIARECFDEAVQIAVEEYSTVPDWKTNEEKMDFAEQLADRHFNRALFFLLTKNHPCVPSNVPEIGYKDLITAKRLDREAHDLLSENSSSVQSAGFDRAIRRLRGLVKVLEEDSLFNDVWGIRELIEKTERILYCAWEKQLTENAEVIPINNIGRLQQLECIVIRYELCYNNVEEAARISMRMLVEDDFILEMPFAAAATALLTFMRGSDESSVKHEPWAARTESLVVADLRSMFRQCKLVSSLQLGKNVFFYLDSKYDMNLEVAERVNENIVRIIDEGCHADDYIGFVRYDDETNSPQNFCLVKKGDGYDEHRSFLTEAVKSTDEIETRDGWPNMFNGLRRVVQLFIDPFIERNGNDTWIVILADGDTYDNYEPAMSWILELNRQRETKINAIIVGIDVSSETVDIFEKFCSVSKDSTYIAITSTDSIVDEVDRAFQEVDRIMKGNKSPGGLKIVNGVTMERF